MFQFCGMYPLLIDTHAHIYLPAFDADRYAVMQRAADAGVGAVYLPAIDRSTHEAMLQTAERYPVCQSMMGLHPCSVNAGYETELEVVERYLAERTFVALGEIGLDFYWDKTFADQQYAAFRRQVELSVEHNLPVVIHSRNAVDECIAVVKEYPKACGVFHCFSGSAAQATEITKFGFLLGIGGVLTFKNAGVDKAIAGLDPSYLLLETDAPYLAPVPHRGKRNEPAYVKTVAEKLAAVLDLSVEEVARTTAANAEKLFGR